MIPGVLAAAAVQLLQRDRFDGNTRECLDAKILSVPANFRAKYSVYFPTLANNGEITLALFCQKAPYGLRAFRSGNGTASALNGTADQSAGRP
jgi:hypothetical protein